MTEAMKLFLTYVEIFFILYLVLYSTFLFGSVLVGSSELYKRKRMNRLKNVLDDEYYIPISILVPAYNEEITVTDTVHSLLELDYPLYEIIVMDDGSRDETSLRLIREFKMEKVERPICRKIPCKRVKAVYEVKVGKVQVTLIQKENGGKADSLNMGINASRYPYFVCMDADSVLQRDSLREIIKPILENSKVIASGGLIRISNCAKFDKGRLVRYRIPWNPIVGVQMMEYDRSFLAARLMLNEFNGNLIISGAFGLFQKAAVVEVGGYDSTTMGEDMELVMKLHVFCRIHKMAYRIQYTPEAICWSQAPSSLRDLMKQRRRWHLGLFQSMVKHRQIFFNGSFGLVGAFSYLYYLLYELLSPMIELFGLVITLLSCALNLINVRFMVLFYGVYAIFGCMMTLTAFCARIYTQNITLNLLDMIKAVFMCILESVFFRFVLTFIRVTAFVGYKSRKREWGHIQRQKMDVE